MECGTHETGMGKIMIEDFAKKFHPGSILSINT